MENIPPIIFDGLALLMLFAIWIYFFVYSYRCKVEFPWGMIIVVVGILVSGVDYYVSYDKAVIFSISLPLVVSLTGVLWDINNIRKQLYSKSAREFLRFVGTGLIYGFLLAVFFIALDGTKNIPVDPSYTYTSIIALVIQGGIAEELLFRGYLLSYLKKYECNHIFAIVFQALIFAFLHVSLYSDNLMALLIVFLTGVTAGYLTWKNNNLVSAFVIHIVFNLMTVIWWLATA